MIRHALDIEAAGSGNHDEIHSEIPPCVRNVILQQLQKPTPNPTHTIKMMKKLSKNINVPDDPSDPTAFTQDPMYCNVPKYKSRYYIENWKNLYWYKYRLDDQKWQFYSVRFHKR